jgi:hypothetical protein
MISLTFIEPWRRCARIVLILLSEQRRLLSFSVVCCGPTAKPLAEYSWRSEEINLEQLRRSALPRALR